MVREGGIEEEGTLTGVSTPVDGYDVGTIPSSIISIRLRSSFIRAGLAIKSVDLLNLDLNQVKYEVILNPTLTGTLIWSDAGASAQYSITTLPYANGSGHVMGASILDGGQSKQLTNLNISSNLGISANIDGVSDIISIIAQSGSGTQSVFASVSFLEYL